MTHLCRLLLAVVLGAPLTACTINFELTSQRTALENQVMGAYKELDDDLVLVSSVRGPNDKAQVPASKKAALDARQNQDFNRDDIDELKDKQILGETAAGRLTILPKNVGGVDKASAQDRRLAETMVEEENRDRSEIWRRIIAANTNLTDKDLGGVQKTYAKMQREGAREGHWYQTDDGQWQQKR